MSVVIPRDCQILCCEHEPVATRILCWVSRLKNPTRGWMWWLAGARLPLVANVHVPQRQPIHRGLSPRKKTSNNVSAPFLCSLTMSSLPLDDAVFRQEQSRVTFLLPNARTSVAQLPTFCLSPFPGSLLTRGGHRWPWWISAAKLSSTATKARTSSARRTRA